MPNTILQNANKKLKVLERSHGVEQKKQLLNKDESKIQMTMFKLDDPLLEELRDEIKRILKS